MKKVFLLSIILTGLLPAFSLAASIDTSFRFSTIETEHFSVHFHEGLDDLAQKAASMAEDVHPSLIRQFSWEPKEKTQIVLIDDTDFTNGFATVLPYNIIYIQTVPPSLEMTIGEYDDWLRMVIVHEYTHILTMDPVRGYSRLMRGIFGRPLPGGDILSLSMFLASVPPNVLMPGWWLEGMATWSETRNTGVGRGRSTYYDMILRMAVAEDNIPSVDQINGEVPYWPDGHLPYIFGLRLVKYISDKYGAEALGVLNTAHAGRAPYFISAPAYELSGKGYGGLYAEMINDLKAEESKRLERLRKERPTLFKTLTLEGERLTNPRYSPDGARIAFNRRDPHRHEGIVVVNRDGSGETEVVRRRYSDGSVCWALDGSGLYFSQAEVVRGFNIYQDLYFYDMKRKELKRLTNGMRVREPDISPDGKRLAVVVTDKGEQGISILRFDGDKAVIEKLTGLRPERLSNPRWSTDGRYIAYAVKDTSGKSGVHIYDVAGMTDSVLIENSHNLSSPVWSPDGSYIIYTSDETGVFNLFAHYINNHARFQVTHILGGAFQPDISPAGDEIAFSSYDSRGFKISQMENKSSEWMSKESPRIEPYWRENAAVPPSEDLVKGKKEAEARPYSALDTLVPRFWLPTIAVDHKGAIAGMFTAGQDVLGYNTLIARTGYGTGSGRGYYDVTYLNEYTYPTLMLQAYRSPVGYTDLLPEGDYYEMNEGAIIALSIPVNRLESTYRFTLGYHIQRQDKLELPDNANPAAYNLFKGDRNNLFGEVEFFNSLKYPYSISHEEGRSISLKYKYYSEETGSDMDSREYIASYAEYLNLPLSSPRHHVLYYKFTGAASEGDRCLQQAFQIGGTPPQLTGYPLRGYPSKFAAGKYVATGTLEYRAPVTYIFQGSNTNPFFYDRLHMAAFVDAGEVWDHRKEFSMAGMRIGAGLEARLDMTIGYRLNITPAIGVAHGFDEGGETNVYLTVYTDL